MEVLKIVLAVAVFISLAVYMKPLLFKYCLKYVAFIIEMSYNDYERYINATKMQAHTEWRLHLYEMQHNKEFCKSKIRGNVAWLTAMTNDDFVIGAVLVAYMIKNLSCEQKMIALVANGVSGAGRNALTKVGYDVKVVEPLDCNWMDRRKGRKEQNIGIIGTHMRFHAWNYTRFKKLVYFDADIIPLTNIDEIFDLDTDFAAAYCGRPGVLDPCFNAGLIAFRPSLAYYKEIMQMWFGLSDDGCPNDQVLLWHYYADTGRWTPLPYAYNVRREIYHPMKVYHFACCLTPKPWRISEQVPKSDAEKFKGPISEPWDLVTIWWRYFYRALDEYDLHSWWTEASKLIKRRKH